MLPSLRWFIVALFFFPLMALAQGGFPTDITNETLPQAAEFTMRMVLQKEWAIVAAVAVMVMVFVARTFLMPKLAADPRYKDKMPLLAAMLALMGGAATLLLNPTASVPQIAESVWQIATMAMGTWSVLGKFTLGKLPVGVNKPDAQLSKE